MFYASSVPCSCRLVTQCVQVAPACVSCSVSISLTFLQCVFLILRRVWLRVCEWHQPVCQTILPLAMLCVSLWQGHTFTSHFAQHQLLVSDRQLLFATSPFWSNIFSLNIFHCEKIVYCLCLFLFWCKFCNLLTRLVGSIPMFSTCSSMFNLYIFLLSILRNYISWERWRPIVPKVYPIPSPHMMYKSASGVRRIGGTGGQKWALRVVFRVWMKWILNIAAWCVTAVEVRKRAL